MTRSGADEGGLKEVFYFRAHKDGDAVRRKGMG